MNRTMSDNAGNRTQYISGDHSTHTIDQWRSVNTNISYSLEPLQNIYKSNSNNPPPISTVSNAQLVRYMTPHAKLIIAMRNPVTRSYSLYKMHEATSPEDFHAGVVNGIHWWNKCIASKEQYSIIDCMYMPSARLKDFKAPLHCTWINRAVDTIRRSIYFLFLVEWFSVFPRQQFLLFRFDDYIVDEPRYIHENIFPFLELPAVDHEARVKMQKQKRVKNVYSLKGVNSAGNRINRKYKEPMLQETEAILRMFYTPYNKQLAILLDDDLYQWKS